MEWRSLTVGELLASHSAILEELRRREILRSANNPISDLSEVLFCRAFAKWQRANNSVAGHDATGPDGRRYQIKGRRLHSRNTSRQLSAIRNLLDDPFDLLAGILFDAQFGVHRAALIPLSVVKQRARRSEHTNSWIFILRDDIWNLAGVQDVTPELRAAAASL